MTDSSLLILGICLLIFPLRTNASDPDNWPVREQTDTDTTYSLTQPPMRVIVDNLEGYVHVVASDTPRVRLRAHKTVRAETPTDLTTAEAEVNLHVTEKPGQVSVYYDAPWRCNGNNRPCHSEDRHFYEVVYDLNIEVPRNARIVISTVNRGDIQIENTAGDFDVKNVNGAIQMTGVNGSGDVSTVNGPVTVRFAKNPAEPCVFRTVNGPVEVYFRPNLAASLLFKTFNGQVYADFDVQSEGASETAETGRKNGKFVYRSNGFSRARAGAGGPDLKFDTLNGDIRLHERRSD